MENDVLIESMLNEQKNLIKDIGNVQTDVGKLNTEIEHLKIGQEQIDDKLTQIVTNLNGALDKRIDNRIILQDIKFRKENRTIVFKIVGTIVSVIGVIITILAFVM